MSPGEFTNRFLEPPVSFEVDLGLERDASHFANGHDPRTLDLHGGDDIGDDDLEKALAIELELDLDAFVLDEDGVADALAALDRNGGEPT